jgi:hypothetical protein
MPPRKSTVRFEVEWSSEAWAELRTLPASERRPVLDAAARLTGGDRKSAGAVQEGRTPGDHRLLYRVVEPLSASSSARLPRPAGVRPRVQILCALVAGAAVARPGVGELRRRGAILRQLGGGIPHEVVRRAWLAELRR